MLNRVVFGTLGCPGVFQVCDNMIYSKAFYSVLLAGLFCSINVSLKSLYELLLID